MDIIGIDCNKAIRQSEDLKTLARQLSNEIIELENIHNKYTNLKDVFKANEKQISNITEEIDGLTKLIIETENKEYEIADENEKQKDIRVKKETMDLEVLKKVQEADWAN